MPSGNRNVLQIRLTERGGEAVRLRSATTGETRSAVIRSIVEDWCAASERKAAKAARKQSTAPA